MEKVNVSRSKSVLLTGMTQEGEGAVKGGEGGRGEGGIEREVEGAVKGGGGGEVEGAVSAEGGGEVSGRRLKEGGGEVSGRRLKEGERVAAGGASLSKGGDGVRSSSPLARRDKSKSTASMFQNVGCTLLLARMGLQGQLWRPTDSDEPMLEAQTGWCATSGSAMLALKRRLSYDTNKNCKLLFILKICIKLRYLSPRFFETFIDLQRLVEGCRCNI